MTPKGMSYPAGGWMSRIRTDDQKIVASVTRFEETLGRWQSQQRFH